MGFFSKIKRLWKKPEQEAAPAAETTDIAGEGLAAASGDVAQAPPAKPLQDLAAPAAETPVPAAAPPPAADPNKRRLP